MGLAHAAQLRTSLSVLKLAISIQSVIRCCVRCRDPFGISRRLGWSGVRGAPALPFGGHAGRVTLPLFRGSGLCFGGALGDRALPELQPGGGSPFVALLAPRKVLPADVKDLPPRPFRTRHN